MKKQNNKLIQLVQKTTRAFVLQPNSLSFLFVIDWENLHFSGIFILFTHTNLLTSFACKYSTFIITYLQELQRWKLAFVIRAQIMRLFVYYQMKGYWRAAHMTWIFRSTFLCNRSHRNANKYRTLLADNGKWIWKLAWVLAKYTCTECESINDPVK